MTVTPQQNAMLWGQVFELAVKRGVLAYLLKQDLIVPTHPSLAAWTTVSNAQVYAEMKRALGVVDDNAIAQVRHAVSHMLQLGYGLGWTGMREYWSQVVQSTKGQAKLQALWCPLTLPSLTQDRDAEAEAALAAFVKAFALPHPVGRELTHKGHPAWSDFTVLLKSSRGPDQLLCLEFSYNASSSVPDFSREDAHLEELQRYARYRDARSVFSQVCAEVTGERFQLSRHFATHFNAFTGRDKPFYKLCQGASYADTTMALLQAQGLLNRPCEVRVIAVTSNGFESLSASLKPQAQEEPRLALLRSLGQAYRATAKLEETAVQDQLADEIAMAFNQLALALPASLRKQVRALAQAPQPGDALEYRFSEEVEGFVNPAQEISVAQAQAELDASADLDTWFGQAAHQAVTAALLARQTPQGTVTWRDLHAAAVVAGIGAARQGALKVLALEGNPGIGKTTAVKEYLATEAQSGYLLFYTSPRVVINKDVTASFARTSTGVARGILTLTTNVSLNAAASRAYREMVVDLGLGSAKRRVDSATVVDGVENLVLPEKATWFVTPEQEAKIEQVYPEGKLRKQTLNERQDLVQERVQPGVLRTLAQSAQALLEANPDVNRVVLTAAVQGYRKMASGHSTVDSLGALFKSPPNTLAGKKERREFAQRVPTLVVMIDELAGDGAGALFVHEITRWLDAQFLEPFAQDPDGSPFTVVLVVADASLGNDVVLRSYLEAGPDVPDKVLVSNSAGRRPFRLAQGTVRLGGVPQSVLHVMTNSFPAGKLLVDYHIRLNKIYPERASDSTLKTLREAIRSQQSEQVLANARDEILRALRSTAPQVIFFAQDKAFLRDLKQALETQVEVPLDPKEVAVLDSSVKPEDRRALVSEAVRDGKRVFLMTSSGARGVSFPKATWIIAAMPRFNIEASLMELAQLVYRGRGHYTDPVTGKQLSGDLLDRRVVLLVDDFLPVDLVDEDPRTWLRRASDLLTLVLMLRSTLYTRILGDAGLPGRDLALVPVGYVGSSELLTTMSQALTVFLREAAVYLKSGHDDKHSGLVAAALRNVLALFSTFTLKTLQRDPATVSFSHPPDLDAWAYAVSQERSALLPPVGEVPALWLPDTLSCFGPFWLEDWGQAAKSEVFTFDRYTQAVEALNKELFGQLGVLMRDIDYPPQLRGPARDLYRILSRKAEEAREFSTFKALSSQATWLVLPLNYTSFWRKASAEDGAQTVITQEEPWLAGLSGCLAQAGEILPAIPRYEEFPYAAAVGVADPVRRKQVFDDRYFMASSELNLLNALLLHEPQP